MQSTTHGHGCNEQLRAMDEQLRAVDEQLRVVDVMNNSRIGALYTQKGRSWSTIPSQTTKR